MSRLSNECCAARVLFGVLFSAALLVASCGTAPVRTYYMLENTAAKEAPDDTQPLCRLALGLNPVEVSTPYDISKIIFRPDPLEVRFYTQSHWVSPPEEMFAKLISRRMEESHFFSNVDSSVNVSGPHLSLLVKVYAIEEVDKGKDWQGRLAMNLFLRDEMEDVLLWKYRFDVTQAAAKAEVKSVIQVLNDIYNQEIEKAVASLGKFLNGGGCHLAAQEAYSERDESEPKYEEEAESEVEEEEVASE